MPIERDRRAELRVLLAEGDSERLFEVLADDWPADALQLVGDALRSVSGGSARGLVWLVGAPQSFAPVIGRATSNSPRC